MAGAGRGGTGAPVRPAEGGLPLAPATRAGFAPAAAGARARCVREMPRALAGAARERSRRAPRPPHVVRREPAASPRACRRAPPPAFGLSPCPRHVDAGLRAPAGPLPDGAPHRSHARGPAAARCVVGTAGGRCEVGGAAPLRGGAHQQGPAPRSGLLEGGGCGGEGGRTRTALPPARRAGGGPRRVAGRRGAAAEVVRDRDQCEVRAAPATHRAEAVAAGCGARDVHAAAPARRCRRASVQGCGPWLPSVGGGSGRGHQRVRTQAPLCGAPAQGAARAGHHALAPLCTAEAKGGGHARGGRAAMAGDGLGARHGGEPYPSPKPTCTTLP